MGVRIATSALPESEVAKPVQDSELLTHDLADLEQRLSDRRQPRKARYELTDPRLISTTADDADFQTEVAQRAAQIGFKVE
jgi:hypothetical protein